MTKARARYMASLAAALAMAGGCGSSTQKAPLLPSIFVAKEPATRPTTRPADTRPVSALPALSEPPRVDTTRPVTRPTTLFSGQYQTLGAVVSEVNGNPIFANRIIRQLRPELAARAAEMDMEHFRKLATEEIGKEIGRMQRDELFFGAAQRNLASEDLRLAESLAIQFRTRKITEAGGSIEMAQRRAEADGETFDTLVFEEYRKTLVNVYLRKKVYPRIQVSANDMRSYYQVNVGRDFTEREEVTFRLIKIDTRISGGKEKARSRANDILQKARSGDFAEVARMQNDDQRLARAGGAEDPIQRKAYGLEKVEAAAWKLPIGQVSDLIEDTNGFYIIKVESRKEQRVIPFEDPGVQNQIFRALWGPQSRAIMDEIDLSLRRNAMVRPSNEQEAKAMMQPAIEMAMQGYPQWASAKAKN